jgi:hypothetical protein
MIYILSISNMCPRLQFQNYGQPELMKGMQLLKTGTSNRHNLEAISSTPPSWQLS